MNTSILVINLKKSLDRRSYIENHLKDIPFTFIDAMDGRSLSDEEQKSLQNSKIQENLQGLKNNNLRSIDYLSSGELGTALSHKKAYQYMIDHNLDYALIFEDDIYIKNSSFLHNLEVFFKNFPKKSVIHLGTQNFLFQKVNYLLHQKESIKINPYNLYKTHLFSLGAFAYALDKEAALALLSQDKVQSVADDWEYYAQNCSINLYSIYPEPIGCLDFVSEAISTIGNERKVTKNEKLRTIIKKIISLTPILNTMLLKKLIKKYKRLN